MKKKTPALVTRSLTLRAFRPEDRAEALRLFRDPKVYVGYMLSDMDDAQADALFERFVQCSAGDDRFAYAICLNGCLIGWINDVGLKNGTAELGYVIAPEQWNRGYASEALSAAIGELFRMGFTRVRAGHFAENPASRRVMEKCGMHAIDLTEEIEYRGKTHLCRYLEIEKPSGPRFALRRACKSEAAVLARLANEMWNADEAGLTEEFRMLTQGADSACFILYDEEKAVGFAQCGLRRDYVEGTETSPVGYLEGIYIRPQYRGEGGAKRLLKACEGWAREKGCREFASDCEADNEAGQAFHKALGFAEAGRIVCYTRKL